jgi:endoglucanase
MGAEILQRHGRVRPSGVTRPQRKHMAPSSKWISAALAVMALSAGCDAGPTAGGAPPVAASTLKSCGPDGVIDDGEDNNNRVAALSGRGGYWYTYGDKLNSTITPAPGGTFSMSVGGANGSKFAANMKGKIGGADQPPLYLSVGMGLGFTDPRNAYDASKYKGIAFWAKKGPGSTGKVRLKVPDVNTDPQGKVCTDACFNDFGADLDLTDTWTRYTFAWSDLHQLSGWGSPSPPAITEAKLYGIQFQVNEPAADYDVWVDDLEFLCP